MIDLEVIMKKEILQILQKINEAQDPIKIEKLITKALEIDEHDPMVLLLAAEFSNDLYERLNFLDHGIQHLEQTLYEEGLFDEENIHQINDHPLGALLIKKLKLRFNTFMDLDYYHQAIAEYVQILNLEENDSIEDERAILASLYIKQYELAHEIFDNYETAPFTIAFPYSIILHQMGHEKEAQDIIYNLIDYVPNFKTFFTQLSYDETPLPQSEEDFILLNTILATLNLIPEDFLNIININSYHN